MSAEAYSAAMASLSPTQLKVLRISIMAERRLRTHYQRTPDDTPSLQAAYAWAREQVE